MDYANGKHTHGFYSPYAYMVMCMANIHMVLFSISVYDYMHGKQTNDHVYGKHTHGFTLHECI